MNSKPDNKPFCYWFGSQDPHREYEKGSGKKSGLDPSKVRVPGGMPDVPEVREDILDYYYEVERFDKDLGTLVQILKDKGQLDNTLIVVTSDNGMPFPRAKATLYDWGTHMPLVMYWKGKIQGGKTITEFVNHVDFAPTFLEATGQAIPAEMSGKSLLGLLSTGKPDLTRDKVFFERERHANVRRGDLSYPCRAVRTKNFLYIRNLRPDRWPAGDPQTYFAVGPYGDVDDGPSKQFILKYKDQANAPYYSFYTWGFAKRPQHELYDLSKDPQQLNNIAATSSYKSHLTRLQAELNKWMRNTGDPRVSSNEDPWDKYPYYGVPVGPDTYKALEKK
jgi:arylsulfatase A-like enzyme